MKDRIERDGKVGSIKEVRRNKESKRDGIRREEAQEKINVRKNG